MMKTGKKKKFSFRRAISRLRGSKKAVAVCPVVFSADSSSEIEFVSRIAAGPIKVTMKTGGARLWMKLDRNGLCEVAEWDKNHKTTIINRAAVPARDLRILGPVFSHSCNILARDKAMVVNLEFIKAIVTAEEVFLLDPLHLEVLPFVDQLRRQIPLRSTSANHSAGHTDAQDNKELPFEFQVLEVALEVVCSTLGSTMTTLEQDAYPAIDELARNVSTKNLERVRTLKSNLTRLLARVQKVRNEIENLLDNSGDLAALYLTRKLIQNQQFEAPLVTAPSNALAPVSRLSTPRSATGSMLSSNYIIDDVEDLEMLLEAYFTNLDMTRNKILLVREYIGDTEDYVNIQLDHQRNELIQLQLTLVIVSFSIAVETMVSAMFGMNFPCSFYQTTGLFEYFVGGTTIVCMLIYMLIMGYARRKKLLGS